MRLFPVAVVSFLLFGCRADGTTNFVADADGDGVNEELDCDDNDADVGAGTTYYYDGDQDGHGDPATGDSACERPAGFSEVGDDCDDTAAGTYPGAEDVCDKIDNDCDGVVDNGLESTAWYGDTDGDGYGDDATVMYDCSQPAGTVDVGGDCNDADAAYNPGATEEDCEDPNDYNCDGSVGYDDSDADGFAACAECDDGNPAINPDAVEVCNGADDDCDTLVDDLDDSLDASTGTLVYADLDGDGFGDPATFAAVCEPGAGWVVDATDCDDARVDVNPGASEVCNGLDDDCDTLVDDLDDSLDVSTGSAWYTDADGDGYGDDATVMYACDAPAGAVSLSGDCDDADGAYNPGAVEADCTDPADYNCDGSTGYLDADSDGYAACDECDDGNAAIYPGAGELCDGADNDCDGTVDEDDASDASTWYADSDADTFGDASVSTVACSQPSGFVADATDCDDSSSSVNPAQLELCNGIDDNCDGVVDESTSGDTIDWYADVDGDGYGDAGSMVASCSAPADHVLDANDCDDSNAAINPAALETCDGTDNDCDGDVDEDSAVDVSTWYADSDGDTYGDAGVSVVDCDQPAGYVADTGDCDDTAAAVNPDASEVCNSIDDDCDGSVDEGSASPSTWYADTDGDGYGDAASSLSSCSAPAGYVADSTDCSDTSASVHPGASEACNLLDDDCDGTIDDGVGTTYYADVDGDGYGDASTSTEACSLPAGYATDSTDCDDTLAAVHPLATEACNGYDDDCDGSVDEAGSTGSTTWYADTDGDGYGDSAVTSSSCSAPSGYVASATDCDDGDIDINPGESDACDTVDNDCDGSKDNDGLCPCDVDEYGGHAYMFCDTTSAVPAAQTVCLTYGYDLVAINDSAENTWVVDGAYAIYSGKWWTGYTDGTTEGTWTWDNGDTSTYTNWHSGEPNNSGGNEDCMQLGRWTTDDTWNDETCTDAFRYICEE